MGNMLVMVVRTRRAHERRLGRGLFVLLVGIGVRVSDPLGKEDVRLRVAKALLPPESYGGRVGLGINKEHAGTVRNGHPLKVLEQGHTDPLALVLGSDSEPDLFCCVCVFLNNRKETFLKKKKHVPGSRTSTPSASS